MRPTQQKIKDDKCPVCGDRAVHYEIGSQHTSGEWNEVTRFGCGCVLKYIPGYSAVRVYTTCPKAHEVVIQLKKQGCIGGEV